MPARISTYNPSRGGDRNPPTKQYRNADGPGGTTVDYGPRQGTGQRDQYDQKREEYGNSPWYGRNGEANPMPWSGPPGQERGQRTPFFTPDAGDPRNAGYFVAPPSAEEEARYAAMKQQQSARSRALMEADPGMQAAMASGNPKQVFAAMSALKNSMAQQRFIDQGGTAETWQNRFNTAWPVPASPTGNYQYGPGRPGPTPPGVAQSAAYQPGQSKSGAGQTYGGPAASTGQSGLMPVDQMLRMGMGQISGAAGGQFGAAPGGGGLSPDIMRKLAMGMPAHLLGLPAGQGREFPGGVNPVNPGPIGGRPIPNPPPMTPNPIPPGSPIGGPPGGYNFHPNVNDFGGGAWPGAPTSVGAMPFDMIGSLGMGAFGYSPMNYGGYNPQAMYGGFY